MTISSSKPEVGKVYKGTVRKVVDFGAFVEILPGAGGLLHISQIGPGRMNKVTDVLNEGEEVVVKVLGVDKEGFDSVTRKPWSRHSGRTSA